MRNCNPAKLPEKLNLAVLSIIGYFAVSIIANASVAIAITQEDCTASVTAYDETGTIQSGTTQSFGPSSENPYSHGAGASISNSSGSYYGYASADLSASFSDTGIAASTGCRSYHDFSGGGSASASANFYALITISDQPVSFTLTFTTNQKAGGATSHVSLSGPNVNISRGSQTYDFGTLSGTLAVGQYAFSVYSSSIGGVSQSQGFGNASAQVKISPVPESSTFSMLAPGALSFLCILREVSSRSQN